MLRIYLDQFIWVGLARGAKGRGDSDNYRDALDLLDSSADLGLASFPLSMAHYLEVYTQRNAAKRYDLARVMGSSPARSMRR